MRVVKVREEMRTRIEDKDNVDKNVYRHEFKLI